METFNSWHRWKEKLGKVIDFGETIGLSEKTIDNISEKIGNFMANNIDPRNDEERLLKTLWDAADEEDKRVLAKIIVKIAVK